MNAPKAKTIRVDFSETTTPARRTRAAVTNVPMPKAAKPARFTPAVIQPREEERSVVIPDVTGLTVRRAALAYAKAGIYVLPVKRGAKHPGSLVGDAWEDKASTDPKVINGWWKRWPDANVGICPGKS